MSLIDLMRKYSLPVGMAAMTLSIIGTFVEGGSIFQKWLFFIPAIVMGITAWLNNQKMFITLQIVVIIGTTIAFFNPDIITRYGLLMGSGIIAIGYLIKTDYIKEDVWWPIGGIGLLSLAFGFATDAANFPILFNTLLALAGLLIAVYSAIGFFYYKVKIAIIWLILNTVFFINPLRILITKLFQ